jgi:two-component system, NtrC family, nitrogen regulation sensor histidine kinase NtrY
VTRSYLIERLRLSTERQGLQRAEVAQKAVEDFAYFQRGESPADEPVTDPALVWVASLVRNDVDLFRAGEIAASSKRELYGSRLLGTRVSGPVYRALVLEGQPEAIRTERIGRFSYLVASVPVRLDRAEPAIVSIPLALRQREVQSIVDDLDRTIRLASLLFLAGAALLAHRLARHISDPLRALTAATERVARGDLETRVAVRSRDELSQLVDSFNRMAADLDTQRRELERSNRLAAFAEMARQVAHEVKNPLTPIQLSAQHLRRVFRDSSVDFEDALLSCTATILEQVRKLREIATEFSSFARPPAADKTRAALPVLLEEATAPYRPGLPPGVTLQIFVEGPVPMVEVDRRLIDRALVNILENALHAVGESGTIHVSVRARDGRAEVEVADSGPGIEPALRGRIFEPFFSTKTSGSGLGLALVKKIVEDHGGVVSLDSEPGAGTRLRFSLPAAP